MTTPRVDPKYEVVRRLREGGMGAIYLVRHRLLDELRVVKVLRSHLNSDEDLRQRFLREARTAIQLRHPNIAQLYDFSVDEDGNASIVLEYIDGFTVEEFGRRPEARDVPLDLALAQQALRALGFLHRKGFVHRDVAPDNLMVTRDVDGEPLVKLIDLGIVKTLRAEGKGTATSLYLGKPRYSSPEQLISPEIDARADLYSFGVMLYELVTGCYPIRGHDLPSLIAAHLHGEPVPFDVSDPERRIPDPLRRLLLTTMAKEPGSRPESAEDLAARLAEIQQLFPPPAPGEAARRLDAARAGARHEREEELTRAGSEALSMLGRGEYAAARQRVAEAVEQLGNDPELTALLARIEAREREVRQANAEAERLERLLGEAGQALAAGAIPDALSRITEVLARRPEDSRARSLAARIEERRQADEARAVAAEREGVVPAATLRTGRPGEASLHEAPTAEVPIVRRPPAAAPRHTLPIEPEPQVRRVAPPTPAPARGGLPAPARGAIVLLLAAVVAVGGWLLWRALRGEATGTEGSAAYREALGALATGDAAGAAQRLREQLLADAAERPGYLPHFHYGQALIALGRCDEGLKALAESERQGALAASPEGALLAGLRSRCTAAPDVDDQLRPVEDALALLERQISEIDGSRTSTAVAALWTARPRLAEDFERARALVAEARQLAGEARAAGDLGRAFDAADRAADARDRLAGVLRALDSAAGAASGTP